MGNPGHPIPFWWNGGEDRSVLRRSTRPWRAGGLLSDLAASRAHWRPLRGGKTATRTGEAKQQSVSGTACSTGEVTHSNSRWLAAHFGAPPFFGRDAKGRRRWMIVRAGRSASALGARPQTSAFASPAGLLLGIFASRVLAFIVYEATPPDPPVQSGAVLARHCGNVDSSAACFAPPAHCLEKSERPLEKRGNTRTRFPSTWRWLCLPRSRGCHKTPERRRRRRCAGFPPGCLGPGSTAGCRYPFCSTYILRQHHSARQLESSASRTSLRRPPAATRLQSIQGFNPAVQPSAQTHGGREYAQRPQSRAGLPGFSIRELARRSVFRSASQNVEVLPKSCWPPFQVFRVLTNPWRACPLTLACGFTGPRPLLTSP
jgi:hypothetical protein